MTPRPWLASYHRFGIHPEIDPARFPSVVDMLDAAIVSFADKPAFRAFGQSLTYADVDRLSGAFAAWLQQALGVQKGDRIAVMMPNLLAFPIVCLGILRTGAVQANVNPLYTPRELQHQLDDSGCETIVIFNGATPTLAEVIDRTAIRTVITVGVSDGTPASLPSPPVDARLRGTVALDGVLREGMRLVRRHVELTGDDLLFLQYTGGTTGISKGAALSHRNLVANTEQLRAFMPTTVRAGEEVVVTAIPLYHIFALMVNFITYFAAGAENWLVANPRDMNGFIDTMRDARPTVFTGVNTLFAGLALHPRIGEVDFSRLTLALGGGAPVLSATSARWKAITGTFIREGYGLSETSPVLTANPEGVDEFTGTTGLPVPSTDIKLLDDTDAEVGIGQPGEVCARGPQVMAGYWNCPQGNATAFTSDGYFRTGDIGQFDAAGFLKIVDRKKDMVLVSGFNVYPNEVEAVAAGCAGVVECACVGVPDEKTGEAVRLFVVREAGGTVTEEQLRAHCCKDLASYKVPKSISFVEALPKSTVGKILRRALRDGD